MRAEHLCPPGTLWPQYPARPGTDSGDDTRGLRAALSSHRRGALRPRFPWLDGLFLSTGSAHQSPRTLPSRRQHAPGTGRSDGGPVRTPGGREPDGGPRFDQALTSDGYQWWYVDALSDDAQYGITIIALIGSVFSPYYAWARRRGPTDPTQFCALNVALYGKDRRAWAMTERGHQQLARSADSLMIGPSRVAWDGNALVIDIDERGAPLPKRIHGRVRVHPRALTTHHIGLDPAGHHRWWPIAPESRVEVELRQPGLHWSGDGYLDSNDGDEPLERGFREWDWSRAKLSQGSAVLYDMTFVDGEQRALALRFDGSGAAEPFQPPPRRPLKTTFWWRIPRATQGDEGHPPQVLETLEDTPFYARSTVRTNLLGESVTAVHESLSLTRFATPWVQMLLPFRMPRIARGRPAG
jgi:carotenoid 1,2-hydratase